MSRKRRNTSSPESDYSPPSKKPPSVISHDDEEDSDSDEPQDIGEQPRLNPDFGQSNAFPGLGAHGDELFYGPAADGIDYLRMVRSEAKSVPNLLVVPTSLSTTEDLEENADGYEEEDGFYYDGTYTGLTTIKESTPALPAGQQQYYQAMLERFSLLRQSLRLPPSAAAIAALGEARPITLPPGSKIARDAWERHILHCEPHPVQVGSIDSESVVELVKLMGKRLAKFLDSESEERVSRVGSWVWALLARLPDRGELGAEEIAELRIFASTAARFLKVKLEGMATEDSDETSDEDEELGAAVREALMAKAEMQGDEVGVSEAGTLIKVSLSKAMILETITTVIGEIYGQRDFLQHRDVWGEGQGGLNGNDSHTLSEV